MSTVHRRFRAPQRNREILTDPPFAAIPELIAHNRHILQTAPLRIDSIPLPTLRSLARREVLSRTEEEPFIVTGHQPELFHPGVWVKNFAAHGLALRLNGQALNLVVDNDAIKSCEIPLPTWSEWSPQSVHRVRVRYAQLSGEQPWETAFPDEQLFHQAGQELAHHTENWGYQPLLAKVWSTMVGGSLAERFSKARMQFETAWGCQNHERSVSQLCQTESFRHFARHLISDATRFRAAYNSAVARYRRAHGLRSRTHPVPDLAPDEIPFWMMTHRGRQKATIHSPIEQLRPRALTLTLFARLCLGDLFIHGIGGGKYDEVTDSLIRDYFEIRPPGYQVLSATFWLPLPSFAMNPEDVRDQARLIRDLHWNPHRYLGQTAQAEHEQLSARQPQNRNQRMQRRRSFRRLAERLRDRVQEQIQQAEGQLTQMQAEVAANAILHQRDYSWVLYPEPELCSFLQEVQQQAARVHSVF